ncbi:3-methyl-2-oxobutanoate hydroxymethyltransferase [Halohasta litchfieldiae]|jgi:3-methyl-2-oxobutanoate hydroxymethyltransferase|uniref:3-methyl-2-oxobutanoate hydroxymethyltransferase n=1 Tax=Halohasta litchfieldiae TaxID=1073996 RepID=A0A1H6USF2_9EURY|nr:3-methyl-2-oxobutanoate hydroxymethyltransferase [Halohasta litchfieldiae]ATW89452.1 3-methyl-2-oxobutanoate hydroxymethyltransferase [Halohasta litchfieldiae]SEI92647.1 ketopantoate hydroxymethyltransferase [Halohasta litchfieldiae]
MTTTRGLRERDRPITMLTAYDALTARIVEAAGIDVILVGDSMGTEVLGYDDTLAVTREEMQNRTAAVVRGTEDALVVADMPFLSVGVDDSETIRNAGRMLKEAGADAVKLESGPHTVEITDRLTQLGIPVMAHLGLTPQHVNQLGGYSRQGTTTEAAEEILSLARAHEEAGAFALVLEHVPANVAGQVTEALNIPTIGIGGGPDCDGQVLVLTDVMGLSEDQPPFAEQFGDVEAAMTDAVDAYRSAVENGEFPSAEHSHVEESVDDLTE